MPDEGLLDLVGELVDDAVRADVDALAFRERARLGARPHVEADHERVRGRREVDVVLGDPADAGVDDVDPNLRMVDLAELAEQRLDRSLHVALEDDVEILDDTLLHLREQALERDAALGALGELLAAKALGPLLREILRLPLVLDDPRELARGRRPVEAEDLDGVARTRLLHLLARVVVERPHLAGCVARDDRVADTQRAAVHEHRRDRPTTDVEAGFDDRPGGLGRRVRAKIQLGIGHEQQLLQQLVEIQLLLGGDLCELGRASPLLRLQPFGGELGADAVEVRIGNVDLVDGDDDRDPGGARMRDRLARLRHHTVVGGDDEDRDVGDLRPACAHGGERLVARRVEERDPATVEDRLVGADVLRDPARLGVDDGGLAGWRRAASSCRGRRGP